jgi:hypothetical protein
MGGTVAAPVQGVLNAGLRPGLFPLPPLSSDFDYHG